jgi:hypothetical protein
VSGRVWAIDQTSWTVSTESAVTAIASTVATVATREGAWSAATAAYTPGHVVRVRSTTV